MSELPLAGIRIVDLTHVWSGPMATRVLAGLGAEVIKVEGPRRMDWLRGSGSADVIRRYPAGTFGTDPHNRNAWFNTQNTDKRSVVVDLKEPEGLSILLDLIRGSHALIANMRPGVLHRLGLTEEALWAANPDLVVVEMPGYGNEGPYRDWPAYGAQFEALSGGAVLNDPEDPLITGFALADPVAGLHAALALAAALVNRDGRGARLQVIQRDAILCLAGEYLVMESLGRGAPEAEATAVDGRTGDHGITAQCGDEKWVAVSARSDSERAALAATVGDRNDRAVREWALHQPSAQQAAMLLRQAGVPAAAVQDAGEVFSDPVLRSRDYFVTLHHPSAGRHDYPGLPYCQDRKRVAPRTPAPALDEHTDMVLRDWAQCSDAQIAQLRVQRVIGLEAK